MEQPTLGELNEVILRSREEAIQNQQFQVDLDHFLLAMVGVKSCYARQILLELGCDLNELSQLIKESLVASEPRKDGNIILTRLAEDILKGTYREALNMSEEELNEKMRNQQLTEVHPGSEHMLLSILQMKDHARVKMIQERWGIDYEGVKRRFG